MQPAFTRVRHKRKSLFRPGMIAATVEGFPAIVIILLLGGPFLTGYLLYLGANSTQIGIVLAIPSLANVVQIFGAFLIQKFQNRKIGLLIFGGMHRIIWTSAGLIPFLFPHQWWVVLYILVTMLAFTSNAFGIVFFTSLMADMVPVMVRGRYFGFRNSLIWAFGCIVLVIGGQILDRTAEPTGFHILYIVCAVCAVLNVLAFTRYPNMPFVPSQEQDMRKMVIQPFLHKPFLIATLFIALWLLLQGLSIPFYNYVMLDLLKISYSWISIITMTQNVAMMLSYYIWGTLNMRHSTRTLLFWTLPIIALSSLLWGFTSILPIIPVLFLIHIALGIGTGGLNQLMFNFVIGDTPKSERPMFVAVFYGLTGLTGFIGPVVGGVVYKKLASSPMWVQTFGISVTVGVILLLVAVFLGRAALKERRLEHH
jgi:MFS family permease